jgi:Aldo/keto reductase family
VSTVSFGSAHLLVDHMPPAMARQLLEAAIAAGATRLDTAPLYGHGAAEALVAEVAGAHPGVAVTTKVGLEPVPPPPAWRRLIGSAMRRLPSAMSEELRALLRRGRTVSQASGPSGRFGLAAVRRSIDRSLTRLGHVDRLLLHEVHPADINDELLRQLERYRDQGDVTRFGVATGNAVTLEALRRGQGLFTVAHVSVDPLGVALPELSAMPAVRWVGHGALGVNGRSLALLQQKLQAQPALASRWQRAVTGTEFASANGLARALLARASAAGPAEVLVATRRPERVSWTVLAASGVFPLPPTARAVIDEALARPLTPKAPP